MLADDVWFMAWDVLVAYGNLAQFILIRLMIFLASRNFHNSREATSKP